MLFKVVGNPSLISFLFLPWIRAVRGSESARNPPASRTLPRKNTMADSTSAASFLDWLDSALFSVYTFTKSQRTAIKAGLGAALLFHGNELLGTVMLLQGIHVVGTDLLDKSLNDLYETYVRTRKAIKENLPTAAEVADLEKKLRAAAEDLKGGRITASNYDVVAKDMKELQVALQRSQSFIHAMLAAVNPQHLTDVAQNLHVYLLSVTAIAHSTTAATITVGLNIGHVLSERTFYLYVEARQLLGGKSAAAAIADADRDDGDVVNPDKWTKTVIQMVGNSMGLFFSYTMQKISLMFGACTMGSDYLLSSFEEIVDPALERMRLPTLRGNHAARVVIQSSLITFGFYTQLRGGSAFGVRFLLSPLFLSEAVIKTYILANVMQKRE